MMKLRKKLMFSCLSLLFEPIVYAKGGGAGTGSGGGTGSGSSGYNSNRNYSSGSGWVFWYYSTDGGRKCGNYCIVTFAITGFLILLVILCGIWRCREIHRNSKRESRFDIEASLSDNDDDNNHIRNNHNNHYNNDPRPLYPPLPSNNNNSPSSHLSSNNNYSPTRPIYPPLYPSLYPPLSRSRDPSPPAYGNVSSAPEPTHLHGLRHESTWDAYKAGQKFSRENPIIEDKPPPDHIRHILTSGGGPKAWKIVLEENVIKSKLATVYNNGLIIEFHKKLDVTVQANYPMIKITDDSSDNESEEIHDIITPTSITEKNLLPTYSQSNDNNFLQYPQSVHIDDTYLSPRNKVAPNDMMTTRATTSKGGGSPGGGTPKGGRTPRGITPRGSPRSSRAVTPTRISFSLFLYYEITILSNPNKDTTIVIGLATKPYPSFRLPGWHRESVGFHSDDGHKFNNESYGGKTYSDSWGTTGDVLGCGYYPETGIVFFTKNGINLGNAFTGLRHIWFPAIGADNKCKIELNFGGEKKFWYEEAKRTSVMGYFKSLNTETYDYEEFNKEKF